MADPPTRTVSRAPARIVWLALSLAVAAAPFLAVRYAPLTDLPQQAAQVRLFLEAVGDPAGPYVVQWGAPNTLALAVLGLAWAIASPLAAGRVAMLLLALAWVAAVHGLAWRRGRPAAAAALASVLVFNQSLYWGFYSFVLGFPVFAGWLLVTTEEDPGGVAETGRPWRRALALFAVAALLYLAHALWLAAGLAWLALETGLSWRRRRPAEHCVRWLAVAPVVACAAVWFLSIGDTDFATPPLWAAPVWRRLLPANLADAAFGGLNGPVEPLLLALLLGWIALGVLGNRGLRGGDGRLAAAGAMLLAGALVLPDKYTYTILFADRWMPAAVLLLVLAAPAPRLSRRWSAAALPAAALLLQGAVTTEAWRRVEREELSGLDAALAALPPAPRVLGLALVPDSRYLESAPFGHLYAYAQVVRGGELNFSFAQFASSPVVYRDRRRVAWTPHLELLPRYVRRSDFRHFDFALIGAADGLHRQVAADPLTEPVTAEGRWRLYRVVPPPAAGGSGDAPPAGPGESAAPPAADAPPS
jgi:hypothetical protein